MSLASDELGSGVSIIIAMYVVWPTPTGLGSTMRYAYEAISPDVCADAGTKIRVEVMNSINVMLDYYDKFMLQTNNNKMVSREELFTMFKEYYDWLQGKS